MDLAVMEALAGAFANWWVIGPIAFLLAGGTGWCAFSFRRGVQRVLANLSTASDELGAAKESPLTFAARFEAFNLFAENLPVIGPSWRDWRVTLLLPEDETTPVRASVRPDAYFTEDLLARVGINPRFYSAIGNLLVGIGLLLTFLGLSLALGAAGSIVGGDKDTRDTGLHRLLDTASVKFVFSLVGLGCSIFYTIWRNAWLHRLDRGLDSFLSALEERIPFATPVLLQAEANRLLRESVDAQAKFGTDLAVNLGTRLDDALDTRLGEHIGALRQAIETISASVGQQTQSLTQGLASWVDNSFDQRLGQHMSPLRDSLDNLANGINSQSQDTMRDMLEAFLNQLRGGSDESMQRVADKLSQLADTMAGLQTGMSDAALRMGQAADEMAQQIRNQTDAAMGRISAQMEGLVAELKQLASQSRDAGNSAIAEAAAQLGQAGQSFSRTADMVALRLEEAIGGITRAAGSETEAATKRIAEEFAAATQALRTLTEQSRTEGNTAIGQLAERLAHAAGTIEKSGQTVSDILASGAGDAAGHVAAAMAAMKTQFSALTDQVGGAHRGGAEALTEAARQAADLLRSGAQDLAAPARELGERLVAWQSRVDGFSQALTALTAATQAAAAPLTAAAADLARTGEAARAATGNLADVTTRVTPLSDAMSGATSQLAALQTSLGDLTRDFERSVTRFANLDQGLAQVFTQLQSGLREFASEVDKFVKGTNDDVSRALRDINATVNDLREVLEENRPQGSGGKGSH